MEWYAISVLNGKEQEVGEELLARFKIKEMLIPVMEAVDEFDDIYKYFSGYIFVKLCLTPNLYNHMADMNCVKFLGKTRTLLPAAIPKTDINQVKRYIDKNKKNSKKIKIKIDDEVVIKSGDLASVQGKVIEISKRHAKVSPNYLLNTIKVPLNNLAVCK